MAFGHAEVVTFALVLQLNKGLHHLLKRHLGVDPRHLKKVDLLRLAKSGDDGVQATPQILLSVRVRV